MKTLSAAWFAEGTIDFEYKQYVLLAYLEEVKQYYAQAKLYPVLADLINHYRNLTAYQEHKQSLEDRFPQSLVGIDPARLAWLRKPDVPEDELLAEVDAIVDYALPCLHRHVEEGRELFDWVNGHLVILPIGVVPLYRQEGYLLLRLGAKPSIQVYQYNVSMFEQGHETLRGIHVEWMTTFSLSLTYQYEQMKRELILNNQALPNPATYVMESEFEVPLQETLLPIAKRRLLRVLAEA